MALSYVSRRGAHCIRHWARITPSTAAEVEKALLTRFRAREESTVRLDGMRDPIGGVERLDRWTWWLDAEAIKSEVSQ